jgi:hypothetical protein
MEPRVVNGRTLGSHSVSPMPPATRPPPRLGRRALNRALLARQLLLERKRRTALEVIEHLVGLQSQSPKPPYVALWSRLDGFRPEELSDLIAARKAVRIALMRGTVHLVSAADALTIRPLVQPVLTRGLAGTANGRNLVGLDPAELSRVGRQVVGDLQLQPSEIGRLMAEYWPATAPESLAYAVRCLVPLVQVPPRGLWGRSGRTVYATAEQWLGVPVELTPSPNPQAAPDPQAALRGLVLRYLGAFGPATVADMQKWSGLTRLGEVVERLGPGLRRFTDEAGRDLWDVVDGPRPDPETPAPVRLIAEFDNLLLAHAERHRIFEHHHLGRIITVNGLVAGTVLIDGFVGGTWKLVAGDGTTTIRIRSFSGVDDGDKVAIIDEATRLLDFTGVEPSVRRIDLLPLSEPVS